MRRLLILLALLFPFAVSCVSNETGESWATDEESFNYYSLDRLSGKREWAFISGNGPALWTWSVTPGDCVGTVVFIHGYLDHSGLSADLFSFLNGQGYRIVAFDLPGQGRSGGRTAGLEDFGEYVSALDRIMSHWDLAWEDTLFIGHSTGGALIIDRLIGGVTIKGAVLAAPLIQFRWFGLSSFMVTYVVRGDGTVKASTRDCSSNEDFNRKKKADPLTIKRMPLNWPRAIIKWEESLPGGEQNRDVPILVLQGDRDRVVFYERNIPRIMAWFPQAKVIFYPGFLHQVLNEADMDKLFGDLELWLGDLSLSP